MFERFSDRARRVVVLAQEEARLLNHNYIGTEHLLLGLLHEGEGVAAEALGSLGVSLNAVRTQVEEIIGRGRPGTDGSHPVHPPRQEGPRGSRRAKRSCWATTTSAPSTFSWGCSAKAKASPRRSSSSSAPISHRCARRSFSVCRARHIRWRRFRRRRAGFGIVDGDPFGAVRLLWDPVAGSAARCSRGYRARSSAAAVRRLPLRPARRCPNRRSWPAEPTPGASDRSRRSRSRRWRPGANRRGRLPTMWTRHVAHRGCVRPLHGGRCRRKGPDQRRRRVRAALTAPNWSERGTGGIAEHVEQIIDHVKFLDETTAVVWVSTLLNGRPPSTSLWRRECRAVIVDGRWKVFFESRCANPGASLASNARPGPRVSDQANTATPRRAQPG